MKTRNNKHSFKRGVTSRVFYTLKPMIPRRVQIFLRRYFVRKKLPKVAATWPIDPASAGPPHGWTGWPDGKKFALLLTHDVDTAKGQDRCRDLMKLEIQAGFRSSFNFVPERYQVSSELRHQLSDNGFEVGVHGLNHDGKLYSDLKTFKNRADRINSFIKAWQAVGFRSPSMHHNFEWLHLLDIEYDASAFDTDPFEPQSDGVGTIFPFIVKDTKSGKSYVELPYTLPQDFTLFVLMKEKNIDIWKRKLDWIAEQGGIALVNSHPDYMSFNGCLTKDEYQANYYRAFLEYVKEKYEGKYWHLLPRDMARHWKIHPWTKELERQ